MDIFVTCKWTGGDLYGGNTLYLQHNRRKIEVKQEIEITISGKKYEVQLMTVLSVLLVLFLTVIFGAYMELWLVYTNLAKVWSIMSLCW